MSQLRSRAISFIATHKWDEPQRNAVALDELLQAISDEAIEATLTYSEMIARQNGHDKTADDLSESVIIRIPNEPEQP